MNKIIKIKNELFYKPEIEGEIENIEGRPAIFNGINRTGRKKYVFLTQCNAAQNLWVDMQGRGKEDTEAEDDAIFAGFDYLKKHLPENEIFENAYDAREKEEENNLAAIWNAAEKAAEDAYAGDKNLPELTLQLHFSR